MNILSVDTSSKAASCAMLCDGELLGEYFMNAGLTHSQTILPMIQGMLRGVRVEPDRVDRFAVSAGPGSFTGLRIGLAAVKGLALEPERLCAAVSTLEALAMNVAGFPGYVVPVMDARRAQVYTALFQNRDGAPCRIWQDEAVAVEELGNRLAGLPEDMPVTLVGDGARLCCAKLADRLPRVRTAPVTLLHQRAGSVALIAARLPEEAWQSPETLAPVYLRLPQAERELLARRNTDRN